MNDDTEPDAYVPRSNMRFNMPASWEDMEALGLDPLTGEAVEVFD